MDQKDFKNIAAKPINQKTCAVLSRHDTLKCCKRNGCGTMDGSSCRM
jgi:hypothetical protein